MSKIFSALKKAQGELADIASPLIDLVEQSNDAATQKSSSELGQSEQTQNPALSPGSLGNGNRSGSAAPDSTFEVHRTRFEETPASHAILEIDRAGAEPAFISDLNQVQVEEVQITAESRIVLFTDPRSPGADRFRYLRLRLRELKGLAKLRTLVITSPLPRDGKSTVAMNLATALAEEGKRAVLLIEADLHNPTLFKSLGVPRHPGVAECVEHGLDPFRALRRIEPLGWYLMQAGTTPNNQTELLQSDSLGALIQKLSAHFEWILIDTPPVGPLSDALLLSRHADGAMLVVRAGQTPQEAVKEAIALLGPKRVLGIILNAARGLNRLYSYPEYYGKK